MTTPIADDPIADDPIEAVVEAAVVELGPVVGVKAACAAVGRSRSSHYRRHRQSPAPTRARREPQP